MLLYAKGSKSGPIVKNQVVEFSFHPTVWGLGVAIGKEPVGLGLMEHYDSFFRLTILCWTFEIVKETFVDEDGLVGEDANIIERDEGLV